MAYCYISWPPNANMWNNKKLPTQTCIMLPIFLHISGMLRAGKFLHIINSPIKNSVTCNPSCKYYIVFWGICGHCTPSMLECAITLRIQSCPVLCSSTELCRGREPAAPVLFSASVGRGESQVNSGQTGSTRAPFNPTHSTSHTHTNTNTHVCTPSILFKPALLSWLTGRYWIMDNGKENIHKWHSLTTKSNITV